MVRRPCHNRLRYLSPIGAHIHTFPLPLPLPRRPLRMVHSASARVPATPRCVMPTLRFAAVRLLPACCPLLPIRGFSRGKGKVWRSGARLDKPGAPRTCGAPNVAPFGAQPMPISVDEGQPLSRLPASRSLPDEPSDPGAEGPRRLAGQSQLLAASRHLPARPARQRVPWRANRAGNRQNRAAPRKS
jgi:hypothetical protein